MIAKILYVILATSLSLSSTMSWAFNQELAASYEKLFQPVSGAKAGKELHLIKPEVFVEELKKGKGYVTIDVRTPNESYIYSMTLPGSLRIPINELFKTETLASLPQDIPIVVVCKTGARATAAGIALRHIGFNDVYILKGGFKALSAYVDPKVANTPPKPEQKSPN